MIRPVPPSPHYHSRGSFPSHSKLFWPMSNFVLLFPHRRRPSYCVWLLIEKKEGEKLGGPKLSAHPSSSCFFDQLNFSSSSFPPFPRRFFVRPHFSAPSPLQPGSSIRRLPLSMGAICLIICLWKSPRGPHIFVKISLNKKPFPFPGEESHKFPVFLLLLLAQMSIASALSAAEIVPQIVPLPPQQQLNVVFNGVQVQPGQELPVHHLKNAPRVTLNVDPESTFSLVLIDPDNLSRKNPSVAEWLHWLVVNIPASNILEGINGGQHQQPYGSPAPQPRTGDHRYVIVLFEHAGRRLQVPKYNARAKFSLKQFMEKHSLGAPLAANYFIAKNPTQ